MRPIRRPHRRRRLARPGAPASPSEQEIPEGIPVDPQDPDESTLIDQTAIAEPVQEKVSPSAKTAVLPSPVAPQDDTVEVRAIRDQPADSKAETAGVLDGDLEQETPESMAFTCACGAKLVATKKTYDTRVTCGSCRTILLVSLIWNPDTRAYEIEPFRVSDIPDLP